MVLKILLTIAACIIIPIIAFLGGVLCWFVIRKLTARMQARLGPLLSVPKPLRPVVGSTRLLQPFWDILKLFYKETVVPATARKRLFVTMPYIALICIILATWFIPIAGVSPFDQFSFSLLVVMYLVLVIPLAFVVGGVASSSPWGVLGSSREVKLVLAYEIPFVLGVFSVALMAGFPAASGGILPSLPGTLSLAELVVFQTTHQLNFFGVALPAWFIILNPFSAIAVFLSLIGKIGLKPMDISDADVEIVAGAYTEYSGRLLGIHEMVRTFLLFLSTTLFVDLFLGGGVVRISFFGIPALVWSIIIYAIMTTVVLLFLSIANTANPRYRIDQAFKWYLKLPLALAIIGLAWTYFLASPLINIPGISIT
ncbi:MAG: complex I subunit 1 family protein [Candidatus Hodarchaeota archaeon]